MEIVRTVAAEHGLTTDEIRGMERRHKLAPARQKLMLELRRAGLSYPRIAMLMSGRNHRSIMWGVKRAQERETAQSFHAAADLHGQGAA